MKELKQLEKNLGVQFKNLDMLTQAVVHRSYLNEHPSFALGHNERLEFLGDAVLEIVVTEYLYNNFPNPEGELTNLRAALVNFKMLSDIARELELEDYLYMSHGEAKDKDSKARQAILANAIEAVIGAIYLDLGEAVSKDFILRVVVSKLPHVLANQLHIDPKSKFQELSQEKFGVTPSYRVMNEQGPDHAKEFTVGVYIGNELVATGDGTSKQDAQIQAAAKALEVKGW